MSVVSREEWLEARLALLEKEKQHTRAKDALAAERRALPWVLVDQDYRFESSDGSASLADLFGDKSQLLVYHYMFAPDWDTPCGNCTFVVDQLERAAIHIRQRDIRTVLVSRASVDQIEGFRQRLGFTLPWYSSSDSFPFDFHVSFTEEQADGGEVYYNYRKTKGFVTDLQGISVFVKGDDGKVYHTYSSYSRGVDDLLTAYHYIDLTPKGRDEEEVGGMGWVKFRDEYDDVGP